MANSYWFYDMTSFPVLGDGQEVVAIWQRSYLKDVLRPKTVFTFQRRLEKMPIEVFNVLYEEEVRKEGRTNEVEFSEFVLKHWFPVFYHRPKGLLMARAKKNIARGAMRTMISRTEDIKGKNKTLDLKSIRPYIERFKCVWFTVDDSAMVSSQALFGSSVDLDMRFDRASEEGDMLYIRIEYTYEGRVFHVGISDEYSVVVFDNGLDEQFELGLVLDVKACLLDRAKVRE